MIPAARGAPSCELTLRFIGMHSLPADVRVDGDLVGGLSGLDYDSVAREWYLVSDDRSEYGPARFFVAEMNFDAQHVIGVSLRAARRFGGGVLGSSLRAGNAELIDTESIRVARSAGELLVAGEGDEGRRTGPWLRRIDPFGHWLGDIPLPTSLIAPDLPTTRGPRPNRSLEGITYAPDGNALWLSMEAPLLQDGAEATASHGADVRLTRLRLADGAFTQYVYAADAARADGSESSDNGVSEIVSLNEQELLVLERSGTRSSDGHFRFHTRLYCANWTGATDVAAFESLAGQSYVRVAKRLLFDFDELPGVRADNLEGMSWGPEVAPGHRSLVFVSDNNFFNDVPTQLLFFATTALQKRARAEKVTVRGAPMK